MEMDPPAGETEEALRDRTVETELQLMAASGEAQRRAPSDQPSDLPREVESAQTSPVISLVGEMGETEGGQAVELELDASHDDDSPPEYTTVLRETAPPPLDSEAVPTTNTLTTQPENSLTVEAPPSYRQLFVVKEEQSHTPIRRRTYTLPRDEDETEWRWFLMEGNSDEERIVKTVLFVVALVVGVCISITVILVGAISYCTNISFYLIVAGLLIFFDLSFHSLIIIYLKKADNPAPQCYLLRCCDCFAFLLFVWLIVGTNWIIKEDEMCSSGVSTFTKIFIVCQYIIALVVMCLCCIYFKTRCSCS